MISVGFCCYVIALFAKPRLLIYSILVKIWGHGQFQKLTNEENRNRELYTLSTRGAGPSYRKNVFYSAPVQDGELIHKQITWNQWCESWVEFAELFNAYEKFYQWRMWRSCFQFDEKRLRGSLQMFLCAEFVHEVPCFGHFVSNSGKLINPTYCMCK